MRAFATKMLILAALLGLAACHKNSMYPPLVAGPSITTQPSSVTVTVGAAAVFTVTAVGEDLSYQWRKNGVVIPGATAATYSIPVTTSQSAGSYLVVVTNAAGSTTSGAALLTLEGASSAPFITSQPVSMTVTAGGTATFTVVAFGPEPLTYQWFKNDVLIADATSATYALPAVTVLDSGNYKVTITNPQGTVTSNVVVLTVTGTTPIGGGGMSFDDIVRAATVLTRIQGGAQMASAWHSAFAAASKAALSQMESADTDAMAAARYPTSNRGVLVSSLGASEQELVTASIAHIVGYYDDATSARLLADYTSSTAYAATYVVGVGSAYPDPDPDFTYLRIDGPRVWSEIFCPAGGAIAGAGCQMVFRDKVLDHYYELTKP